MIHGTNLLFLLIPFLLMYLAFKTKKRLRVIFSIMALLAFVAMPIKLINKPDIVRAEQDAITFDRHQEVPEKVIVRQDPYNARMDKKSKEMNKHSADKLNEILGDNR